MLANVPLFPEQASEMATRVDHLLYFLVAVTGSMAVLVTLLIIYFAARFRRRSVDERTPRILGSPRLEWFWTIAPFFVFLVMFAWGASIYTHAARAPDGAMEVFVVGKQWMWKIQHPGGQREINELHLPVNRAVKLTLTSEDVIHDFFVPAFRTKADVIPGRYVPLWYFPTKIGQYHLFCSQYCGTGHATMVGTVYVMSDDDYKDWLESRAQGSLAQKGEQLFLKLQCITCHSNDASARAPVLKGLYGRLVHLQDGRKVVADDAYIRESILYPRAKIVQGWEPIMPTFKGQVDEEELIQLIAYIRSDLLGQPPPVRNERFAPPLGAPTVPEGGAKPP